ncbi:MAG: methyl-accepting chemotaxis protein, partial [Planctomycetota bacterium]
IEAGGHYSETDFFQAIPVVVGWTTAGEAAEREGLSFEIASFEARNKDNEPASGSFREEMLRDLTKQVDRRGDPFLSRIDDDTNTLHYMRAITLDESCLMCHGNPKTHDPDGDGLDPIGFAMENWPVGYMHGAYEVQMPLDTMDAQIAGFFKNGLLFTAPIIILGFGGFILMLRSLFNRPLGRLIEMVKDVATGDGDLTKRLEVDRKDELGALAGWIDQFIQNLHGMVVEVKDSTNQVASASTEIAASSEELAAGMRQQEAKTGQVSAAVQQMAASVTEVAQKSDDASQAAARAGEHASKGGEVVRSTIEEMNAIESEVGGASNVIGELGQRGEEIGAIISVINDIADQTNLLALNAAIEAARAGEHGRGFAVVADEVRKLAERTTNATDEVASSIKAIQDGTGAAVSGIEASTARVGNGVEMASGAGDALREIVDASEGLLTQVNGIAAAAQEQTTVSDEIARALEEINAVTAESSEGANQASSAAADLSSQSERLREALSRFKTD